MGASATAVEQAVEPLVQASESLDATKQAFEMLSSEWADGRQAIATALTNRRYPTEPSESFHAMADKITNMSYEEGWFAKIGYTDENDGGIKEMIDYSYKISTIWNDDGSTAGILRADTNIVFLPQLNFNNIIDASYLLSGCTNLLSIGLIELEKATHIDNFVNGDTHLIHVAGIVAPLASTVNGTFVSCTALKKIFLFDIPSVTGSIGNLFLGCSSLVFALIKNLGKSSSFKGCQLQGAIKWGTGSEENRQSLIDSLITYSYDRASAGMATATITLSANTKALLTEEEIAQITAKGFTIA